MRSPFRSNAHSFWLLIVAAGCNLGTTRPAPQEKPADESSNPMSWTVKRPRASAVDSGVAVHDAGQPVTNPAPAADSGTPGSSTPTPDAGTEPVEPVTSASIVFSSAPVTSGPAPTTSSFSLSSVPDLYVSTTWSNLCGEHTELRKYYDPSGELFYQKLTAFSTDISEPVPFTRKVGVPHNTSVLPAIANEAGAFVMEDYIGLAGSWIGDHSITGTWKLELYLDNAATPIATRNFELTP